MTALECCGFESQLVIIRKSDCLGYAVLLCLVVCLTLVASFCGITIRYQLSIHSVGAISQSASKLIPHGGSERTMAQHNLQPPGQFDFKNPDDWPRWKRRFEQFRVSSGLTEDSAKKQISTLLYCLGEETEAVLASTNATADERKVYDTVMSKFDGFFGIRKNVIFERARFNRRNQQDGEGA